MRAPPRSPWWRTRRSPVTPSCRRDEPAPQLRLAEEATVRRIREIVGILELVRVELDQRDIEALRHRPRCRPLDRRVGGASTHARQHPLASQLLPQHDCQEGRIDPPRVADEGRWIGPDEGAQLGGWCLGSGHGGIVAAYTVSIKGHERIVRRPGTYYPYDTFKNHHKRLLLVGNQGTGATKWRTRPSWTPSTGRSCGSSRPMGDRVTRPLPMRLDCRDRR